MYNSDTVGKHIHVYKYFLHNLQVDEGHVYEIR